MLAVCAACASAHRRVDAPGRALTPSTGAPSKLPDGWVHEPVTAAMDPASPFGYYVLRPTNASAHLTFRGIKNLDATVDWAMARGLDKAEQFVLTGGSAGGLSTFLHADRVLARVRAASPGVKAWAAPVVGYFLDHDNFGHTTGVPNTPSWADANYTAKMQYIYGMQNLTFGADGGLTAVRPRI